MCVEAGLAYTYMYVAHVCVAHMVLAQRLLTTLVVVFEVTHVVT